MNNEQRTRDCKIIQGHARETRVHGLPLMPPDQYIFDVFGVCAEIARELVAEFRGLGWGKRRQVVEYITSLIKYPVVTR